MFSAGIVQQLVKRQEKINKLQPHLQRSKQGEVYIVCMQWMYYHSHYYYLIFSERIVRNASQNSKEFERLRPFS